MNTFCGLDFGTSNSTIGIGAENTCRLVALDGNKAPMRSAIFCDNELKQWVFGQTGINHYLEGAPGRLMMALKTVLGSPLMNDNTMIFNEYIPYTSVLSQFVQYLKRTAEQEAGHSLEYAVLGRPVHFHDNDAEKDKIAEDTLREIALAIGFKEVTFQYEPIAAAMTYEMSLKQEKLALIVDMGGGTSDFTIIRLGTGNQSADRSQDVLANTGIHIAGTDFDQRLSLTSVMPLLGMGSLVRGSSSDIEMPSMYYHDLTTWHTLSNLYGPISIANVRSLEQMSYAKPLLARLLRVLKLKAGHHILDAVETGKQQLSDTPKVSLDLSFIEDELTSDVSHTMFHDVIEDQVQKIITTIKETVSIANIQFSDINAIFYTGGSTRIPFIRNRITELFPSAEIVEGDAFGSVGMGLTIEAMRRYR